MNKEKYQEQNIEGYPYLMLGEEEEQAATKKGKPGRKE